MDAQVECICLMFILIEQSGNTLFAMGTDGILLRTTDDQWKWVRVGSFFQTKPFHSYRLYIQLFGLHSLNLILLAFISVEVSGQQKEMIGVTREVLHTLQLFHLDRVMNTSRCFLASTFSIVIQYTWPGFLAIILILYILGIIQTPCKISAFDFWIKPSANIMQITDH